MPRLLLVEDELVNRDLFRRRLERKGYTIVTAEDGLGAVALTAREKPDLVIMDLGLPDIDGWEATRRIKADPATAAVPVLVLSAHATEDARERAFAAGCVAFETKPVNWEALFKKIEEALAAAKPAPPAPPPADEVDIGAAPPAAHAGELTDVIRGPRGAARPARPPSGERKRPAAAAEHDLCPVQPKRILVVEDNDPNRVMLCRRLNKRGYATAEAANGRLALEAVRRQPFDLVLCDITMPEVDGFEVLREMKATPGLAAVPVIMLSALDDVASAVRCIEMGAEDYLQKPYEPVLLFARIHACLDKRRLRDREVELLRVAADLTRAAEQVEKGEFDAGTLARHTARTDEMGTLARVFARMAAEVQARERRLRDGTDRRPPADPGALDSTLTLPKLPDTE